LPISALATEILDWTAVTGSAFTFMEGRPNMKSGPDRGRLGLVLSTRWHHETATDCGHHPHRRLQPAGHRLDQLHPSGRRIRAV